MNQNLNTLLMIGGAALALLASSLFAIDETQQAIVLRFGEPVKTHREAGLKMKLPWPIETVAYFDRRILDVDPRPERVNLSSDELLTIKSPDAPVTSTLEQNNVAKKPETARNIRERQAGSIPIMVDTFARYRIIDPLKFLQRMGFEINAEARIENVMNAATRDVLGRTSLSVLLSPKRASLMREIKERVNKEMMDRGVEIVDIRISRADLTDQLLESTVNRMITERSEQATEARAKGQELAQEIRSTAEKERTILLAEAIKQSEILRGEGDQKAIETITAAANQDPDFYAFLKTMFAYQNTLATPDTSLVLSPDSAYLRYFKSERLGGSSSE